MSRFRVIKSKGKFYVVAQDTNSLAGGPFEDPGDATAHSDRLNVLEVQQADELKKRQASAAANRITRWIGTHGAARRSRRRTPRC